LLKITKIKAEPGHILTVYLDNGSSVTLDMSVKLHTARFAGLADEEVFLKATADGNFVKWSPMIEMSITDVLDIAGSAKDRYSACLVSSTSQADSDRS
jgi:hypothetical protein